MRPATAPEGAGLTRRGGEPARCAALPLGVRNRLAELVLESFDAPDARATLEAVAAACRGGQRAPGAATRLVALGWFVPAAGGSVRLTGALRPFEAALCRRAGVAADLLAGVPATDGATLGGVLTRAALLAGAGLYFEVHELLEPWWMRAAGDERLGLQGLIQVAVALHHAASDNQAGAISRLGEGLAKLQATPGALPLATAAWAAELAGLLSAWRAGTPPPPVPRWPAPTGEPAWRCS